MPGRPLNRRGAGAGVHIRPTEAARRRGQSAKSELVDRVSISVGRTIIIGDWSKKVDVRNAFRDALRGAPAAIRQAYMKELKELGY